MQMSCSIQLLEFVVALCFSNIASYLAKLSCKMVPFFTDTLGMSDLSCSLVNICHNNVFCSVEYNILQYTQTLS